MPNISKYALETSVVLGALLISAAQFILQDASRAVATLAVFLAAGTRMAPALLRIQQGFLTINNSLGSAEPTLRMISDLSEIHMEVVAPAEIRFNHKNFIPDLNVKNLNFSYRESSNQTIRDVSFEVSAGETLAVVGPSGSGKSTLLDLILGVIDPNGGTIEISGKNPKESASRWPGAIAYVPQEVVIINGSVSENIMLGYDYELKYDEWIKSCLHKVRLDEFVSTLPNGAATRIGDTGIVLSGGQRQRIGIARALFTNPKLLILDEATSALDAETENAISESIKHLKGETTLVIVAHRLSTVRDSDKIAYIRDGRLETIGTFDEVRKRIPDFDIQAKLMGL
jgi:ABC-type multidrug transport system fused ATPase/permease subunit